MAKDIVEGMVQEAGKDLTRALFLAHKKMRDEWNERQKMERLKKEITEDVTRNVLQNINVVLMDKASPQIQKFMRDVDNALRG